MRNPLNCPNCGAPITSDHCEYCGATFHDFSCIDTQKPSFIKLRMGDDIVMLKAYVMEMNWREECGERLVGRDLDGRIHAIQGPPDITCDIRFMLVPFEGPDGRRIIFKTIKRTEQDNTFLRIR